MRGLYFSDKHDHPFNEFSKPTKDGLTTLLVEHYKTYDWIADEIIHHRPDYVVNLGDSVLTIGYVDAQTITCVQYGDKKVRDACKKVGAVYYPMIGNHDIGNDATRSHVLPFIQGIITTPTIIDNMFFFPFYRDWKPEWDKIKDKVNATCRRAFIHLDITGARFNFALTSASGICPSEFNPEVLAVAGHFHTPQFMSDNFACIGSCMYKDFRDEIVDIPRGIWIDDHAKGPVTGSLLAYENPHTSLYHNLHVIDDEDLTIKLSALKDPGRTHLRLTFPDDLEPFVKTYKDQFRSIKTIPLKNKKPVMVSGTGEAISNFNPAQVLDHFISLNKPAKNLDDHRAYAHDLVNRVLGAVLKSKTRHHVKFLSMHCENFMSFLSLDVRFDESGVVYVDGIIQDQEADVSNGSGKSSIFEAIYWCLTGEVIRNSKDVEGRVTADDVINDKSKCNCLVSLVMEVDDQDYQVTRTRKYKEFKPDSDLRLWMSGNLVAQGLELAKKHLESVTGMDSGLFRHTTLLVDSLSTRFSQLSGRARLELIENVIQLDLYDLLYNAVHDIELKTARGDYDGVKISLDRNQVILSELTFQHNDLRENLDKTVQQLSEMIQFKQQDLSTSVEAFDALEADIKNRELAADALSKGLDTARQMIPYFDESKFRATTNQIRTDITLMKKLLSDKIAMSKGVCPACGKAYEATPLLVSEITHLETTIVAYEKSLDSWNKYEETEKSKIRKAQDDYEQLSRAQQAVGMKLQMQRSSRNPLDMRIKALRSEIQEIIKTREGHTGQLTALVTRITKVKDEVKILTEKLDDLKLKLDIRLYWDAALAPKGGCRMSLLQDALSQLSEYSVDYSNLISNGRVSPQLFITGKGEVGFDVTQIDAQRKYGLSSSGQRRMVDLGIQLALARLSSRFSGFTSNLLILDECEDKLDASARRHLIALLEKISEEEKKIILIASHNKDIKSYVGRTWLVTQTQGVSVLSNA